MKTLYILIKAHSDYDEYDFEIVGVTDDVRVSHTGSCKCNVNYGTKHKCKGFKLAKEQPPVYQGEEVRGRMD